MKKLLAAGLALALAFPACALAQSALNGTWKTDVSSMKGSGKPVVISLKDGVYANNANPPIKVKADGEDHAVTGHPNFDTMAIAVVDDHSFRETEKKAGKVVATGTFSVAPDGNSGTYQFTDDSGAAPVTGKLIVQRVAKGAPGSNAAAGTWKFGHYGDVSASALTATYKVDGDTVSFSDPTGDSYTAKLNGKAVPFKQGSGVTGTTVSVERDGNKGLRETYYRNGKKTGVDLIEVAADGHSAKFTNHDLESGRTMVAVANKQ